jgi:hypothetical protein
MVFQVYYFSIIEFCWIKIMLRKPDHLSKYIGVFSILYFGLVKLGWIKMLIKNITIELNISVLTRFSIPDCIVFHVYYFSIIELGWIKIMIKKHYYWTKYIGAFTIFNPRLFSFSCLLLFHYWIWLNKNID